MPTRTLALLLLLAALGACSPTPPPATPVSESEVQDFVRAYLAAYNSGDATKIMSMITKDAGATSISYGEISRGWEEIRKVVDENNANAATTRITVATVTVQPIAPDLALAFAPFTVTVTETRRPVQVPGAATIVVRRSGGKLELIHEHYSARLAR